MNLKNPLALRSFFKNSLEHTRCPLFPNIP